MQSLTTYIKNLTPNRNQAIGLLIIASSLGLAYAGTVTIPNNFTAGTKASADEVNANFTAVKAEVDDNDGRISTLESGNFGSATFNGNLIVTTNGRLGVREASPVTDIHLTQSDGLIAGTGGMSFSRSTTWKIMHTGSHFSFVEDNVRRAYVEAGTGTYVVTSDARMKKNVEPMNSVLGSVMQLRPVRFQYLTQRNDAVKKYGFMAQDVATAFPDLVHTAEDGTLGLGYDDFAVLAVVSVQEQQAQIDALKQENEALRAEIANIKARLP